MDTKKERSRRDFLGLTGKAGLSTLVASAAGINLGVIDLVHAGCYRQVNFGLARGVVPIQK